MKKVILLSQIVSFRNPWGLVVFGNRIAYMHDFGFYDNIDGPAIIDIFDNKISNKNYACETGFYDNKLSWQNKIKNL